MDREKLWGRQAVVYRRTLIAALTMLHDGPTFLMVPRAVPKPRRPAERRARPVAQVHRRPWPVQVVESRE